MKTSSCKAKGRKLQNQVRDDLLALGFKVRSRIMGESGSDIEDLGDTLPVVIEAKNTEKIQIWKAMEQAISNAKNGKVAVVVFKKNGKDPLIVLPWAYYLTLLAKEELSGRSSS